MVLALVGGVVLYRQAASPRLPGPPARVLGIQLTPPAAASPGEDPRRGLVYRGLRRAADRACGRGFVLERTGLCTHGPDPAPAGVDVGQDRPPLRAGEAGGGGQTTAAEGPTVLCEGDGQAGPRVQALYVRPQGAPDRLAQYLPSFRTWAAAVDSAIDLSARETGGSRRVRFVHDPSCALVVESVVLPPAATQDMDTMISELWARGYNRSDRLYLAWVDDNVYCGIATLWLDDQPGPQNRNNTGPGYARVDAGCWGLQNSVEAHELMHNLGAVQDSAPHAANGHCIDDYDRMCYGPFTTVVCPDPAHEGLFDCNHDDYFSTNPAPGSYLANHWNAANASFLAVGPSPGGRYTPLPPRRILDTRTGLGVPAARPLGPNSSIEVQVTGVGGIPATGVSAVAVNVTVTNATAPSYLTVWPAGFAQPEASNLNYGPGDTVSNLVVATVGAGGRVRVYNAFGNADVIIDVAGWVSQPGATGNAGRYRALTPSRIMDTRSGVGGTRLGPGTVDLQVSGRGNVPSSGATAVALNLTVVNPTATSYLTVFPTGSPQPLASNLNFKPGQIRAVRALVKLGEGGKVSLYNAFGTVDVIVDVGGWFTDETGASTPAGELVALSPTRILDTRSGLGGLSTLGAGQAASVQVGGRGGVPSSGATAAILNVTAVNGTTLSHLTVWPAGEPVPLASDVNFLSAAPVPNLVVVKLGAGGQVSVLNAAGRADVIFDVVGWLS